MTNTIENNVDNEEYMNERSNVFLIPGSSTYYCLKDRKSGEANTPNLQSAVIDDVAKIMTYVIVSYAGYSLINYILN